MSGDIPPLTADQAVALRQKIEQLLERQSFILLMRCDDRQVQLLTNSPPSEVVAVIRQLAKSFETLEDV